MSKSKVESGKRKVRGKARLDFGPVLLITGAAANVTIWIGAFVDTESQGPVGEWVHAVLLPILGGISGLAMGITVAAGLVYVLGRVSSMKPVIERKVRGEYRTSPNIRFYTAWTAIILILVISPALLAPYVLMTITAAKNLYAVLGDQWAGTWSVGRVIAADLAMGAVAMVHGVQVGAIAPSGRASASPNGVVQSNRSAQGTAKASARRALNVRACEVKGCGLSYRWPQGKGAHYKKHHPDLVIRKGIPVRTLQSIQ